MTEPAYHPEQEGYLMKKTITIQDMVLTALGMALVFVATMYIKVPNALDGYFNLGDGFILLFASFLSPGLSFLAGGLGSALADVAGGYAYYFLPALLIKGLESVAVSWLIEKYGSRARIPAYLLGSVIMVTGYFFAKWYLKGSAVVAAAGIPENLLQTGVGVVIAVVAYPLIQRGFAKSRAQKTV